MSYYILRSTAFGASVAAHMILSRASRKYINSIFWERIIWMNDVPFWWHLIHHFRWTCGIISTMQIEYSNKIKVTEWIRILIRTNLVLRLPCRLLHGLKLCHGWRLPQGFRLIHTLRLSHFFCKHNHPICYAALGGESVSWI